jgi:hypothetical protein
MTRGQESPAKEISRTLMLHRRLLGEGAAAWVGVALAGGGGSWPRGSGRAAAVLLGVGAVVAGLGAFALEALGAAGRGGRDGLAVCASTPVVIDVANAAAASAVRANRVMRGLLLVVPDA